MPEKTLKPLVIPSIFWDELDAVETDRVDRLEKRVAELEAIIAGQAPSTPEPEKSYAGYVERDGAFYLGGLVSDCSRCPTEAWFTPDRIKLKPDLTQPLIDWLQDTLAEQEAPERGEDAWWRQTGAERRASIAEQEAGEWNPKTETS